MRRPIRFRARRVTMRYNQVVNRASARNRGQVLPGRDHGLLRHVLGVVMVADDAQRDPVGQRGVPVHQFGEGVEVPLLGPGDEIGVIDVVHGTPSPPGLGALSPSPPHGIRALRGGTDTGATFPILPCLIFEQTMQRRPLRPACRDVVGRQSPVRTEWTSVTERPAKEHRK